MRILQDVCVADLVGTELRHLGHDVRRVADDDPKMADDAVLDLAGRDRRVLITLDKDFGELAVVLGRPHSGIVRVVDVPLRKQARAVDDALNQHRLDLERGAIVTIEPGRVRIRQP